MKKLLYILGISIIVLSTVLLFWFYWSKGHLKPFSRETKKHINNSILFARYESWGPCDTNQTCIQSTTLYDSGELIFEGEKNLNIQLDKEAIEKVYSLIKTTNIMNINCSDYSMLDYSADYYFYYEGKTKKITHPGCEEEIKLFDGLLKQLENSKE